MKNVHKSMKTNSITVSTGGKKALKITFYAQHRNYP